jgi:hypothetical protein
VSAEVFSKIELVITQRDYSYVTTLTFLKTAFSILSVICLFYFVRRSCQFNFSDVGIIQKKLLILVVLLILFNEPLFYFHALFPFKIMTFVNTVIQSTFIAFLLHFWSYLIDTISEENLIRESPIRFYGPKLLLSFLIWLCLLITLSLVRFQEAVDPVFFTSGVLPQGSLRKLSWLLFFLLGIYGIYLAAITARALTAIRRLKESYKFVIGFTMGVITVCVAVLALMGLQRYVSMSSSVAKVVSIEAILNLYIYASVYLYSPCKMTPTSRLNRQKAHEHRQIINQLYEQELPEMPTMRDDGDNGFQDRNTDEYQIQNEHEPRRREFKVDPEQEKKQKIWEAIQKQAQDEDGEDDDSDEDEMDPVAAASEESEGESEGDKEKNNSKEDST